MNSTYNYCWYIHHLLVTGRWLCVVGRGHRLPWSLLAAVVVGRGRRLPRLLALVVGSGHRAVCPPVDVHDQKTKEAICEQTFIRLVLSLYIDGINHTYIYCWCITMYSHHRQPLVKEAS